MISQYFPGNSQWGMPDNCEVCGKMTLRVNTDYPAFSCSETCDKALDDEFVKRTHELEHSHDAIDPTWRLAVRETLTQLFAEISNKHSEPRFWLNPAPCKDCFAPLPCKSCTVWFHQERY